MTTPSATISASDDRPTHFPQIDGLRALAVSAVIAYHFALPNWNLGGVLGVELFFVISGFLITGILLRSRKAAEARGDTRRGVLGRFYARRVLRIFPLYYFVVACGLVLNIGPARDIVWWLLSYTLNLKMAAQGWYEAYFAHFWSLAIEEQFYVFWPWLIVLLPMRWLKHAVLIVILAAIGFRSSYIISNYTNMDGLATYISTLACLDTLGMGALLALAADARGTGRMLGRKSATGIIIASLMVLIVSSYLGSSKLRTDVNIVLGSTARAGLFICLLAGAASGFRGWFGTFLLLRPMQYVGKISYGLYVYHLFVRDGFDVAQESLGLGSEYDWWMLLLKIAVTLAIAALSWRLLERPILSFKRLFADPGASGASRTAPAAVA